MKKIYLLLALYCTLINSTQATIYYVTNNHVSGAGSLGNAITSANNHIGKDSIYFDISSGTVAARTIVLSTDSLLPTVQDTVVIDAITQPSGEHFGNSAAKIEIKSNDLASVGLVIDTAAWNSELYGLFINHFVTGLRVLSGGFVIGSINHGIVVSNCSSICVQMSYVVEGSIVASFIGVDTLGSTVTSPFAIGILLDNSKKVTVGGKQSTSRNVISGCSVGIKISDSKYITIQDNFIGTDINGTMAVPNATGILATQSSDNTKNIVIGGDTLKYANVISGNLQKGLDLDLSSSFIQANRIGTDIDGTLHLGNGGDAIYFRENSHDNIVGGLNEGEGNVIAYNGSEAVVLQNIQAHNIWVRGNRIFCNSQNNGSGGIVLNDGNQGIIAPTIVIVSPNFISGASYPMAEVDIYAADSCNTCEGADYLGTVMADSSGIFIANFPVNGKVTATANDPYGNTSEFAECKDSSNTSCVFAAFLKSKNKVCTNDPVTFSDQSISVPGYSVSSWNWVFGDGQTATLQSPTMTFPQGGTWAVTLIVTNTSGCADTTVDSITVKDGVIANFISEQDVCDGNPVHFTDLSVALGTSSILEWYWTLGDSSHSQFTDFFHTYPEPGEYIVTLTVGNDNNCNESVTDTIGVHAPPQAAFSAANECTGTVTQFTDASIPAAGSTLTQWAWDFGDGGTSADQNPEHAFATAGNYLVTLAVQDNFGCADTTIQGITILDPPVASFTYTTSGTTATFINTSTFSPDFSLLWTFGDGNTSNLTSPTHTYAIFGTYEVCLIVTDFTCNLNDTSCVTIIVLGLDNPNENSKLAVYPNPASQEIIIDNVPNSSSIKIGLFNSLGKEILSQQILKSTNGDFTLALPALAEGIYSLRIDCNSDIVMRKIMISQK